MSDEEYYRWRGTKFTVDPAMMTPGEMYFVKETPSPMRQIEISPGILVQSADPEHINLILMRVGGDRWGERTPPLSVRLPIYDLVRAIKEVQRYYDEEPSFGSISGIKRPLEP